MGTNFKHNKNFSSSQQKKFITILFFYLVTKLVLHGSSANLICNLIDEAISVVGKSGKYSEIL